jgi:hypothetical protein
MGLILPTTTPSDCLMIMASSAKVESANRDAVPIKRGLVRSLSCSETASESSSSHGNDDDGDDDILIQPSRGSFGLEASVLDVGDTLVLSGFLVRATRHDFYRLRDWLLLSDCPTRTIRIKDQVAAATFRRLAYKKENLNHHIQAICRTKSIALDYQIQIDLSLDDLSVDTCISLLDEVKKHPEVKSLLLEGRSTPRQQERILAKLTSLLRRNDRDWTSVQVVTGFLAGGQPYDTWRTTMEHYMDVFSQLYTQHNIPIDIRPAL